MGGKKPYLVALLAQAIFSGMILLSKAAFNQGMNTYVFVFYRQLTGTICLIPFSIVFERKHVQPFSFVILCKIFFLALLGIAVPLNIYGIGLVYTTASLGAASINCLPVTTFAFAVILRLEKVRIRTVHGVAKVAGIVVCLAGVATLALYKGPQLKPLVYNLLKLDDSHHHHTHASWQKWTMGCFLLFVSSICWGLWLVLQAEMMKDYPWKLTFTNLQCLSSAVQSLIVAVALERDPTEWKLGWNIGLFAVAYCGMVTGVVYYLQAWVIAKKGPVFQAMTTPLTLVLTILGSFFLLGEAIYLGSVVGASLLVISLYSVLWGKNREQDNKITITVHAEKDRKEVKEAQVTSSELSLSV